MRLLADIISVGVGTILEGVVEDEGLIEEDVSLATVE